VKYLKNEYSAPTCFNSEHYNFCENKMSCFKKICEGMIKNENSKFAGGSGECLKDRNNEDKYSEKC
jgi:hypothetical protein